MRQRHQDPSKNSDSYNQLIQKIEGLQKSLDAPELKGLVDSLEKIALEADHLETARKEHARASNRELTELQGQFEQRLAEIQKYVAELEADLAALTEPPSFFGKFVRFVGWKEVEQRGETFKYPVLDIINHQSQPTRVHGVRDIDPKALRYGQRLLIGGSGIVLLALEEFDLIGREATFEMLLEDDHETHRALVAEEMGDTKQIVHLADTIDPTTLEAGNKVLIDPRVGLLVETLPMKEQQQFQLEELPNVRFEDIGGLSTLVETIQEAMGWPMLYPEVDKKLGLKPAKGFLLEGAPGVGKTMIAKATVRYMQDLIQGKVDTDAKGGFVFVEPTAKGKTGKAEETKITGHFFHVGGPELLNKWVGETERMMREIFEQAKKIASPTSPVVIFFDEMEALFPTRGSGISSDVEKTNVTQLNALLEGLEERGYVIVIGATNRPDLIDKAVIRPGRFDRTIHVPRPNAEAAQDIFEKYLKPIWGQINPRYDIEVYKPTTKKGKPKGTNYQFNRDPAKVRHYLVQNAVHRMFDPENRLNRFMQIHYHGDEKPRMFTYGDFASGALIENVVFRAKLFARREHIKSEMKIPLGVELKHLYLAIEEAFSEIRARSDIGEGLLQWLAIEGMAKRPIKTVNFIDVQPDDEEEL